MICHKLRDLDIAGNIGEWFHKSQAVVINGTTSTNVQTVNGVTLGTAL